ncbi:putative aminoacylase 1-like protein [Podospora fimiseda]|uniref:Aminoacylase 1-like protein n=1 Tax=Podospora fimiseda TaxID=252190 RepID=A0AAN7BN33_9PEZI|nr:putative aminoacylase 1-like protein [Podospora fimiseda]
MSWIWTWVFEVVAKEAISRVNQHIHSNPELAYEEHKAHDIFVSTLTELGFKMTPHAYDLDTSFEAEFGSGGRLVVFNAEYDALPGIGHAWRVRLLGTPAEEGGGGKLKLIKAGAYKDVSACLMVHQGPGNKLPSPLRGASYVHILANEAHASTAPWEGVNALDAVCLSYNAISMLRQQIHPNEHIHGIIRSAGDRPNVTPANCCVEYYIRSPTRKKALALWERVLKCFEGAALATGCSLCLEELPSYSDLRPSPLLCKTYVEAMPKGTVAYDELGDFLAGTEHGGANHTKPFTAAAGTDDTFSRAIESGKGMASVGWRVLTDHDFADQIKSDWEADMIRAEQE